MALNETTEKELQASRIIPHRHGKPNTEQGCISYSTVCSSTHPMQSDAIACSSLLVNWTGIGEREHCKPPSGQLQANNSDQLDLSPSHLISPFLFRTHDLVLLLSSLHVSFPSRPICSLYFPANCRPTPLPSVPPQCTVATFTIPPLLPGTAFVSFRNRTQN